MKITLLIAALAIPATAAAKPPVTPVFAPGFCRILDRAKDHVTLDIDTAEKLDFVAPSQRTGHTTITCQGDLSTGPRTVFNFKNTGFTCDLGSEKHPVIATQDWSEIIKANGETTLVCRFGPRL